ACQRSRIPRRDRAACGARRRGAGAARAEPVDLSRADRHHDARNGRLRNHAKNSRKPRFGAHPADRGHRQGDEGRSPEMSRRRRVGLHRQTRGHGFAARPPPRVDRPCESERRGRLGTGAGRDMSKRPVISTNDDRTRARILLVDDDERNLLALSEVLEPLADVVTANSGTRALRELLKDDFAVILLDVFMPEMDGYETAALIRKRPQTARIPIIFLSAVNKETEHLMRGYAMGAVDYVFKPVDPAVLKSKVAVFVDLFLLRQQVAGQARAEQELREQKLEADTERLAVERQLQQERLRQAAILESLPLALYQAWLDEAGHMHRRFVGGD